MLPSLSFICRFIVPALWTLLGFRSLARILLFSSARRDPIEASSNGRVYDRSLDPRRWRGMSRIVRFRGFGERRRTGYAPTPTLGDDGGRRGTRQATLTPVLDSRSFAVWSICAVPHPPRYTPPPILPCPAQLPPRILRSMRRDVAFPTNPNFPPSLQPSSLPRLTPCPSDFFSNLLFIAYL